MTIEILNLGAVRHATFNLTHDLTLFCGPNSTGKTYIAYLLHSILSDTSYGLLHNFDALSSSFEDNGSISITAADINRFLADQSERTMANIGMTFGLSQEAEPKFFKNFSLQLNYSAEDFNRFVSTRIDWLFQIDEYQFLVNKSSNSSSIHIEFSNPPSQTKLYRSVLQYLFAQLYRRIAFYPYGRSRMLTVERNSIYTFKTELSLSRNELVDRILESKKGEFNVLDMVESSSRRYPSAIRDSLRIANDIENIQKRKGYFYTIAESIEKNVLHGTVHANKNGDVEFISDKAKSIKLPIHLTSSIVKTLSSLIIYLKHLAIENDVLIIDEPEMNLHPDNQILLARMFALLVNQGLHMFISTHSDYIIREVNNCIMAHHIARRSGTATALPTSLPHYPTEIRLPSDRVGVYYFDFTTKTKVDVKPITISEFGFDVKSIDDAITRQNGDTNDLYDYLRYGEEQ